MITHGAALAFLVFLCVTVPMDKKGWTRHWLKASALFFIAGILTLIFGG